MGLHPQATPKTLEAPCNHRGGVSFVLHRLPREVDPRVGHATPDNPTHHSKNNIARGD